MSWNSREGAEKERDGFRFFYRRFWGVITGLVRLVSMIFLSTSVPITYITLQLSSSPTRSDFPPHLVDNRDDRHTQIVNLKESHGVERKDSITSTSHGHSPQGK